MREIIFIGTLGIRFGRKKVYDYSPKRTVVTRGVDTDKLKQDIVDVRKGNSRLKDMFVGERSKLKHKQELNQITVGGMRTNYRAEHNSKVDKLKEPLSKRLEEYKFNKKKQKEFDEVDNWLENRKKRNQPTSNLSSNSTNTTLKPTSLKTPKSSEVAKVIPPQSTTKTPLLQPSIRGNSLNKIGLGAAGLLTTGAIGYTIYRKTRKDKGRKRGRYAK